MTQYPLRVAKIVQETQDARSFIFEVPRDVANQFSYRAGQFLTFHVPHPAGHLNRCYSLSSAPGLDTALKVTVKRVEGGRGSNWFHDAVQVGAIVNVLPPAGRFILNDTDAPLLLFGGGSGITPMMSLLKSALATGTRRIRLFYANRDKASVIFDDELRRIAAECGTRLDVMHHLDAEQGWTQQQEILSALEGFKDADVYICGPGPFMAVVEQWLLDAGVPSSRVRIERFEASENGAVDVEAEVDDVVPSRITIHFEGKAHKVPYRKGQTILEAARDAGLTPMSSCEQGFCASCAAKRIKGTVVLARNDVYSPEDLADDWILTCQGHCFGGVVEVTYDLE